MKGTFTVTDDRDLGAFCPASLDDWGLGVTEFRVYMHVCRRAGQGACYASQASMAATIGITRKRVNEALKELVRLCFLEQAALPGNRRVYRILPIPPQVERCNHTLQRPETEPVEFESGVVTKRYNGPETEPVEFESGVVTKRYNGPAAEGPLEGGCCNPGVTTGCNSTGTTVVTQELQPYKVLPSKVLPSKDSSTQGGEPYWADSDDAMLVYIAEAFAAVPKYAGASRPPTLKRVADLLARIREEAPDEAAIRDLVDGWRDFHEADTAGKYGRNDPVASLREQIAFRRPKWAVARKRGGGPVRRDSESLADEVKRITGG